MAHVRLHPERLFPKIWLALNAVGSIVSVLAIQFVPFLHIVVFGNGARQQSTDARWAEWALAKPKIEASPFWGYGPGSSGEVIGYRVVPDAPLSVDSFIMTALVDLGVPGLLIYVGLLFVAIYMCLRPYLFSTAKHATLGAALGASMIAFVIYRITLSQADNWPAAFLLLGLTWIYRRLLVERVAAPASMETRLAA